MQEPTAERPEIRLLHHMARTGGMVISWCLSAMAGVYLLSEIHFLTETIDPRYRRATQRLDPLAQAVAWYGLLTAQDEQRLEAQGKLNFADCIGLLAERVRQAGGTLVLRDWSHLDFTGVPFLSEPSFRLTTAVVLEPKFTVYGFTTVRHPIDQWRSLSGLGIMRGAIHEDGFLHGYRRFAEIAAGMGFIRYEDFLADPDAALRTLCAALHLPFDAGYGDRWMTHKRFTGDASSSTEIDPPPQRPVDEALRDRFRANQDYQSAVTLLGYEP